MEPEEHNARTGDSPKRFRVPRAVLRTRLSELHGELVTMLASGNIEARPIALIASIAATIGALDVVPAEPTTEAGAIVTRALGELITLILAVGGRLIEAVLPRLQ
jgi:hypothetical protein